MNEAGLAGFKNTSVLSKLFSALITDKASKTLFERDNASMFGATLDELMRHHPSLKESVMKCVVELLQSIVKLGETYEAPVSGKDSLLIIDASSSEPVAAAEANPEAMSVDAPVPTDAVASSSTSTAADELSPSSSSSKNTVPHKVLDYLDVAGRVRRPVTLSFLQV